MTTLLLIRHAKTSAVGRSLSGWTAGVSLDETGRTQAARLATRLEDARVDAVYSSPLERAVETAEPIARPRGLDVRVREGLGEVRTGEWTGKTFEELAPSREWQRFNSIRSVARIPGGETILDVQARVVGALLAIADAHPRAQVAVVSHADVIRSAVACFLGMPVDLMLRFEIDPASVTVVALEEGAPRLLRLNDTGEPFE